MAKHREKHRTKRVGWLRAAVLGANDGIVSTASLVVGVAAANASDESVFLAGVAGLVAGAMSMAAGEYVSVHSQADTEEADLEIEKRELEMSPEHELNELANIYISRGLDRKLAHDVAVQLTEHDALGAHARDELGITEHTQANPYQAAAFSAVSFSIGAALPLATAAFVPGNAKIPAVAAGSLVYLMILGAVAARTGGANIARGALRVLFWGSIAMAVTFGVGRLFGTTPTV